MRPAPDGGGEERCTAGAFTRFPATGRVVDSGGPFGRSCSGRNTAGSRGEGGGVDGGVGLATALGDAEWRPGEKGRATETAGGKMGLWQRQPVAAEVWREVPPAWRRRL